MARNPKSLEYKSETTDFSFADRYIDDRRIPRYERIKVKFPFIEDRNACGNIDYSSEELKRSYRGKIPQVPIDFNDLKTTRPETLADSKYRFKSDAPNASNIPHGYYGTSSGIFPIDFEPFSIGEPTNRPIEINEDYVPITAMSGEFFYILADNIGHYPDLAYYPVDSYSNGVRMGWEIKPEFDNPTEPRVRYPNGAMRRKRR